MINLEIFKKILLSIFYICLVFIVLLHFWSNYFGTNIKILQLWIIILAFICGSLFLYAKKDVPNTADDEWEEKEEKRNNEKLYRIYIILILIIWFIIRFRLAKSQNFDLDEGIHTYDAKLIFDNKIPFYDYFAREPWYMYLLSFFLKITSFDIFYSRIFSVICFVFASLWMYSITQHLFNQKVAFISIIIYTFSPFFVNITYLANLYTLFQLIIILICFFTIKFISHRTVKYCILLWIFIGASIHFYRITIFFIPFIFLYLQSYHIALKEKIILFLSSFIFYFAPLIIFSLISWYNNFEIQYGTNELIIAYVISFTFLFIDSFYKLYKHIFSSPILKNSIHIIWLCLWVYLLLFFKQSLEINSRVLFQAFILSLFFILPFILIYLDYIKKNLSPISYTTAKILFSLFLMGIYYVWSSNSLWLQNFWVRLPSDIEKLYIIIILMSSLLILFREKFNVFHYNKSYIILLFFAFSPLVFYLIHVQISVNIFFISSIFLIPIIANEIYLSIKNNHVNVWTVVCSFCLFLSPLLFISLPVKDRLWSQDIVKNVVSDIQTLDPNWKYIVTAAPIFAIESGKDMVLHNSRTTIYNKGDQNKLKSPSYINITKNNVPIEEYIETIEKECVKIIILDNRLISVIKTQDILNTYLKNNYSLHKIYIADTLNLLVRNSTCN